MNASVILAADIVESRAVCEYVWLTNQFAILFARLGVGA